MSALGVIFVTENESLRQLTHLNPTIKNALASINACESTNQMRRRGILTTCTKQTD